MSIKNILDKKVDYSDDFIEYESGFNFIEFDIDNNAKNELITKEENISKNINLIKRNTFEFAKNLYEAQQLLANYKTGAFVSWFENLGLKKDTVYRAIDKYDLFLQYHNQKILDLPRQIINTIKKSDLDNTDISEIINSENPKKMLELKLSSFENDFSSRESELKKLVKKREELYTQIEKIEEKIAKLEMDF